MMSYEDRVNNKHEFEDATIAAIQYVAALTSRELELVLAKIADGLENRDQYIDFNSSMFTVFMIKEILALRENGFALQSKSVRFFLRLKKGEIIYLATSIVRKKIDYQYFLDLKNVEDEQYRVQKINKKTEENYKKELYEMSFFRRIFKQPKLNLLAYPAFPQKPYNDGYDFSKKIAKNWNFGKILSEALYCHTYPGAVIMSDGVQASDFYRHYQRVLENKK